MSMRFCPRSRKWRREIQKTKIRNLDTGINNPSMGNSEISFGMYVTVYVLLCVCDISSGNNIYFKKCASSAFRSLINYCNNTTSTEKSEEQSKYVYTRDQALKNPKGRNRHCSNLAKFYSDDVIKCKSIWKSRLGRIVALYRAEPHEPANLVRYLVRRTKILTFLCISGIATDVSWRTKRTTLYCICI